MHRRRECHFQQLLRLEIIETGVYPLSFVSHQEGASSQVLAEFSLNEHGRLPGQD